MALSTPATGREKLDQEAWRARHAKFPEAGFDILGIADVDLAALFGSLRKDEGETHSHSWDVLRS